MRLPSPLFNNLVRNLNEKENCTKDQNTANTDQLQIVFIYFFNFLIKTVSKLFQINAPVLSIV